MFRAQQIETSGQAIPLATAPGEVQLQAASRPLHELAEHAPVTPTGVILDLVDFPFSNDDSVTYYDQIQARKALPEYRNATNRTAVIVGEGSLMAALPMIPEDNIVLLDSSPEMCVYMDRYVEALREAETPDEWGEMMGFKEVGGDRLLPGGKRPTTKLREQALEWITSGYEHPIENAEAFAKARKAARRKAIIPWRADLTSAADMRYLGDVLRAHDAEVTMINITNALGNDEVAVDNAAEQAKRLGELPVTPNVPILATTFYPKLPPPPQSRPRARAAGPFFGLDNLAEHGNTSVSHFADEGLENLAHGILNATALEFALGGLQQRLGPQRLPDMQIISFGPDGVESIGVEDLSPDIQAILRDDLGH